MTNLAIFSEMTDVFMYEKGTPGLSLSLALSDPPSKIQPGTGFVLFFFLLFLFFAYHFPLPEIIP